MIALALTGVIGGIVAGMFAVASRLMREHGDRLARVEALRVPAVVMSGETRWLHPGRDIRAIAADSIVLRAFRGGGVTCGHSDGALLVRYRGVRLPDPAKDSVLVLARVREWAGGLASSRRAAGGCEGFPAAPELPGSAAAVTFAWTVRFPAGVNPAEIPRATPVLIFESGSYHLAGAAFRYRRGSGGRQPLTAEALDIAASAFGALTLDGIPAASPADVTVFTLRVAPLSGGNTANSADPIQPGEDPARRVVRVRVPLRNSAAPVEDE